MIGRVGLKDIIRLGWVCALILSSSASLAQDYEWEYDKLKKRGEAMEQARDSMLNHLEGKWAIRLSYGSSFFSNGVKSQGEQPFVIPNYLSLWQLTGSWHFRERLALDFSIGLQFKKVVQGNSSILTILSGEEVRIEGGGAVFIPVELGLKYYWMEGRFRPFTGVGLGALPARSQFKIAEGNLNDGIDREDDSIQEQSGFGRISVGFDHRLSPNWNLNFFYTKRLSRAFSRSIAGYDRYSLHEIGLGFTILF